MIYVATWGDLVKIGSSLNPEKRVDGLPFGGPDTPRLPGRPVLVGYVHGDIHGERLLHAALAEHRVQGEWFDGTAPSVAALVAEAAKHAYGPAPARTDGRTVSRARPRGYTLPTPAGARDF